MKVKIIDVRNVKGSKYEDNWRSDMQDVITDQGVFIDNATNSRFQNGYNWKHEIGHFVEVHINNDRYGHKWINFRQHLSDSKAVNDIDLQEGEEYNWDNLNRIFTFKDEVRAGIKETSEGDLVLFSNDNSPYYDYKKGDLFIYEGQNTGGREQELIYGNKLLYDLYDNFYDKKIYLFKNYRFSGNYIIASGPYKEDGDWQFPLKKI